MKNNNLYLILLLCITLLSTSCGNESELSFESNTNGVNIKVWEVDRSTHDPKTVSKGKKMISATGDLKYIIENTYNSRDADLDISRLSKSNKGYKVEVSVSDGKTVDKVINKALSLWLEDARFKVTYENRDQAIYTLKVSDQDLLMKSQMVFDGIITSRIETKGDLLNVDANLNTLASTLKEQYSLDSIGVSANQELEKLVFSLKLKLNQEAEDLAKELTTNYGLQMEKTIRPRKFLSIK